MKKSLTYFLFGLGLLFNSCQKEEISYSCNPDIDSWVKNNLVGISHMKSAELTGLDPTVQVAIFRAFSPNQRLDLWLKRLDQILSLEWTEKERNHLIKLRESLKVERFSEELFAENDKFNLIVKFEKSWVSSAFSDLGWTEKMVGNMFARIDFQINKETNLNENLTTSAIDPANCTCSTYDDYCPGYGSCLKSSNCETTSWGCGFLWGYMCNGKCSLF